MKNRRRNQRYHAKRKGHVEFEGRQIPFETRNLSVSGARVLLDSPLLEGADVEIWIQMTINGRDDITPIQLRGTVIWCNEDMDVGFESGIRFNGVSNEQREYLTEALPSYPPE